MTIEAQPKLSAAARWGRITGGAFGTAFGTAIGLSIPNLLVSAADRFTVREIVIAAGVAAYTAFRYELEVKP